MAKTYGVTVPFAGHLYIEVEADSEEEAIDKAMDEATLDAVEDWEAVRQFTRGNVTYCPSPNEAEALCLDRD